MSNITISISRKDSKPTGMKVAMGFVVPTHCEKLFKKLMTAIKLFRGKGVFGCMCN